MRAIDAFILANDFGLILSSTPWFLFDLPAISGKRSAVSLRFFEGFGGLCAVGIGTADGFSSLSKWA